MMIKNAVSWFDINICIGTGKDLVSENEVIKCSNIIKQYKKSLPLLVL